MKEQKIEIMSLEEYREEQQAEYILQQQKDLQIRQVEYLQYLTQRTKTNISNVLRGQANEELLRELEIQRERR